MKFEKPKQLGAIAEATRAKLSDESSADLQITGINTSEQAELGDIVWAETPEAVASLSESSASAAIVAPGVLEAPVPFIAHPLPKLVFGSLLEEFVPKDEGDPDTAQIHPDAQIDPRAVICGEVKVGARTVVRAGAVLGRGVEVGEDCEIGYNAILNWGTRLGNRVSVHGGVVLGTDGFGYVQKPIDDDPTTFESLKIPHVGKVIVEDDVEIGANVCVDRGMLHPTVIGEGTKIDNLVQIGHNCQIGKHSILVAFAGFSGSVTTGKNVIVAGQVGIADHTKIGDRAILMAGTKVAGEIPADSRMMGYPPLPRGDFWKYTASMMDVTHIKKILKALQSSDSYGEFREKLADLKPLGWTFKKK